MTLAETQALLRRERRLYAELKIAATRLAGFADPDDQRRNGPMRDAFDACTRDCVKWVRDLAVRHPKIRRIRPRGPR